MTLTGIPFETVAPNVDESCNLPAKDAVAVLSSIKAKEIGSHYPGRFILAADTLVAVDGNPLGKPSDTEDAARMLHLLSGRTHQVYTGVSVLSPSGRLLTETDASDVTFCDISEAEILAYIRSGEPMDKAGAYALQGRASMWITHLCGNYSSVIGLPLYLVRKMLLQAGYDFEPNY